MTDMLDRDRSIFSEACKGVFDFTDEELRAISDIAATLKSILEDAKKRQQVKLSRLNRIGEV